MKEYLWCCIRLYFAPFVGAYKGIRDEYRRLDKERPTLFADKAG